MILSESLNDIRARLEAATPGYENHIAVLDEKSQRWVVFGGKSSIETIAQFARREPSIFKHDSGEGDAKFFAQAPTDIARLLAALECAIDRIKDLGDSSVELFPSDIEKICDKIILEIAQILERPT